MSRADSIWLLGEVDEQGELSRITLELVGFTRRLAEEAAASVSAVLVGSQVGNAADALLRLGAERVYTCEHASLAEYSGDLLAQPLEQLIRREDPAAVLAGHTALGQDLLPRLAARLDTHVVTDCLQIEYRRDSGELLMTKPIYGGNALAAFTCASRPSLATIRRGVGFVPESAAEPKGELFDLGFDPDPGSAGVRLVESVREQGEGVRLEEAEVVVSGGRGIGGAEGFELLRGLASLLGGAVGASRPPCDMGWAPSTCQVGLTGKVVAPRLYVAVGISGAMQHATGMAESQRVVAINKDDKAHIFELADYGVLGDYREVLPSFMARLNELASETGES